MRRTANPAAYLHTHGRLRVAFASKGTRVVVVDGPNQIAIDIPLERRLGPVNGVYVPVFVRGGHWSNTRAARSGWIAL